MTNFIVVAPITSTIRQQPTFYTLTDKYKIHGQVNCQQLYSYDFTKVARRDIEFIEQMNPEDFYQVAQLINSIFDFEL
ncbi:type II toxin-antitoxin system PemK/MazF family toxin [Lactobacillus helveticus]